MNVMFLNKKKQGISGLAPMDFYRFRHTQQPSIERNCKLDVSLPLWVVGVSPFDPVISAEEGHVVHLGQPRFIARWTMNEDTMQQVLAPNYIDEDLDIMLYEAVPLDKDSPLFDDWFLEAACAVAYSKGLIAAGEIEEMH